MNFGLNSRLVHFLLQDLPWWLLGLWFVYSFCVLFSNWCRNRFGNFYIVESIPNVFVTLGLLGTFCGIAYGLLQFDTDPYKIKGSIQVLLEGLKSAMFTSIVGIVLSLIFSKFIRYFIRQGRLKAPASPEEIALDKLNLNFVNLTNRLANSQYEAIMNAFRGVITDFNNSFRSFVDDLVSSNFAELTESIRQLSNWQREHKESVSHLVETYQDLVVNHRIFVNKTEEWVSKLDQITGQSSRLQVVIDQFNEAFNEDGNLSLVLKNVSAATSELSQVSARISSLVERFESVVRDVHSTRDSFAAMSNELSKVRENVNVVVERVSILRSIDAEQVNRMLSGIDKIFKTYVEDIERRLDLLNRG
jgi:methyl-accepting chemotaxis protein